MIVKQIMTPNVVTIGMDTTLREIRDTFEKHAFHHLLVVERDKLVGVISDRDLLKNLSPFLGTVSENTRDSALLKRHAHQIMRRNPITATPDTDVLEACSIFVEKGVSCLPVVAEDHSVAGIVTWRDILRLLLELKKPAEK